MARAKLGLWSMLLAGAMASQTAGATITLMEKDGWAAKFSGFVEFDMIWDTTRAYPETQGNAAIPSNTSIDGSYGRGQFSLRNSRLAFGVEAPEACGFKTKGVIEGDFLGYDPSPAAGTMSEASFYNNPTFRIRHAYLSADNGSVSILAGQYWSLFGMQPNYFMPTEQVQPVAAMLYLRVPQLRVSGNMNITDTAKLNLAVSAQRPPQRDSLIPDFQGGVRFTLDSWKALFANSSSAAITEMPTSVSLSGLVRDFAVAQPNTGANPRVGYVGWAIAANGFLPVCKHLAFTGEFSYGYGYGDQYTSETGGLSNPTNLNGSTAFNSLLDGGIGGFDSANNFQLVNLIGWNVAGQWHMPDWHTYLSVGAGQLYSPNINNIVGSTYNRSLVVFGNIVHNFTDQIRSGIEYAYSETGYIDAPLGQNHRIQSTTSFIW